MESRSEGRVTEAPVPSVEKFDMEAKLDPAGMSRTLPLIESPIGYYVSEDDAYRFDRLLTDPFGRDT